MAKYSDLYPEAEDEFKAKSVNGFPSVIHMPCNDKDCESEHVCLCGEKTFWLNQTTGTAVCSDECNQKMWNKLFAIYIVQQMTT